MRRSSRYRVEKEEREKRWEEVRDYSKCGGRVQVYR